MHKTLIRLLPLVILFQIYNSITAQDTLRVPQEYATIQEGLDNATTNDVVLIAPGIYYEHLVWPENVKGIDLIGEMGSDSTKIDGSDSGRVLEKDQFSDPNSLIKGLTLQNGRAAIAAGLFIDGQGTILDDVIVTSNETSGATHCDGGGAKLESYAGIIRNCRFTSNRGNGNWTSFGAGLSIELSGNLEMTDVVISGNRSKGGNSSSSAGLSLDGFSHAVTMTNVRVLGNRNDHDTYGFTPGARIGAGTLTIDSCRFTGNSNLGAPLSSGGGLSIRSGNGVVKNSFIGYNYAAEGAGLRFYNDDNNISVINTQISNNGGESAVLVDGETSELSFENCLIVNNDGYGLFLDTPISDGGHYMVLNHVTIANNDKGIYMTKGWVELINSIVWNFTTGNESEIAITAGGWLDAQSSIIKSEFPGSHISNADPVLDPESFEPGFQSAATNYANPDLSLATSFNNVPRPTPFNTVPDIGAIEVNQSRTSVDVRFFYDEDKNGIKDSTEFNLSIGGVEYDDIIYPNTREEGISLNLPIGDHEISYIDPAHATWVLTSDSIVSQNVSDSIFYREILFGLAPYKDTTNLLTSVQMAPFRCGEIIEGSFSVFNEFSVVENGYVWLDVDDRIETIFFDVDPDITQTGNIFGWELTDFRPANTQTFDFTVLVPEISGQNELGDIYGFRTWVEGFERNSEFIYAAELRCSYDPNDKLAFPTEIESEDLRAAKINYTIRFQNTGNDYAKDVILIDTLSDQLIPESFEYVSSSHPDRLSITRESDRILRFYFESIYLIDSMTNPDLSQGYVSFNLTPKSTLAIDSEIENKASIYFDSNPPIVTNTVQTTIVEESTSNEEQFQSDPLSLYPNPTSGPITFNRLIEEVLVYSIDGKLMLRNQSVSSIDIQSLESGAYTLYIKDGARYVSRMVVKE